MQQGVWAMIAAVMCAAMATTSCASGAATAAPSVAAAPPAATPPGATPPGATPPGATPATNPPAWFVQRQAELKNAGYPKLADVPEAAVAGRSATDWQVLEAALKQAGAKLMADPANAPAKIGDLAEFEAKARALATPPTPPTP